jgi:hypothetical protein
MDKVRKPNDSETCIDRQTNVTSCGVILRYTHYIWDTQSYEVAAIEPLVVFCCNLAGLSDELPLIEIDSR